MADLAPCYTVKLPTQNDISAIPTKDWCSSRQRTSHEGARVIIGSRGIGSRGMGAWSLSYDLCIWDPARHAPMPTNADEAIETMERLGGVGDSWDSAALTEFSRALVQRYEVEASKQQSPQSTEAFWGGDPRVSAAACRTAVYRLCLPSEAGMAQLSYAVDAAVSRGLVVLDDENGMCFLPDGTIFPEDMREIWASDLAEFKAGPIDPALEAPDSRNLLQIIASELFDALGRGNKRS